MTINLNGLGLDHGEYYILLLGATAGMMLLAAATSLMTIFLGIELLSISLYVLSGFARTALRSQESAMKYLLLGGFATGFLLYGMALIYGATGSTTLRGIAAFTTASGLGASGNVLLLLGIGFLSVGLAFKASAAPFHMWTPDVYEGAPTLVTTFMSVATKSAAFAAIGRVFIATFPSIASRWYFPLALIAIFSLFIGNLVAITQDNLKRMLAVIMTIVSFYYDLRVVVVMLAAPDETAVEKERVGISTGTVLGAAAAATIILGIFPAVVLNWATHAASLHF